MSILIALQRVPLWIVLLSYRCSKSQIEIEAVLREEIKYLARRERL